MLGQLNQPVRIMLEHIAGTWERIEARLTEEH